MSEVESEALVVKVEVWFGAEKLLLRSQVPVPVLDVSASCLLTYHISTHFTSFRSSRQVHHLSTLPSPDIA
jgi:hypothetical protein